MTGCLLPHLGETLPLASTGATLHVDGLGHEPTAFGAVVAQAGGGPLQDLAENTIHDMGEYIRGEVADRYAEGGQPGERGSRPATCRCGERGRSPVGRGTG
jgi:hypothetical protein